MVVTGSCYLASMPNKPSANTRKIAFNLPKEYAARLEQLAKMNRRTVSNYVAGLVIDSLDGTSEDVKEVVRQNLLEQIKEALKLDSLDKTAFNEKTRLENSDW